MYQQVIQLGDTLEPDWDIIHQLIPFPFLSTDEMMANDKSRRILVLFNYDVLKS